MDYAVIQGQFELRHLKARLKLPINLYEAGGPAAAFRVAHTWGACFATATNFPAYPGAKVVSAGLRFAVTDGDLVKDAAAVSEEPDERLFAERVRCVFSRLLNLYTLRVSVYEEFGISGTREVEKNLLRLDRLETATYARLADAGCARVIAAHETPLVVRVRSTMRTGVIRPPWWLLDRAEWGGAAKSKDPANVLLVG